MYKQKWRENLLIIFAEYPREYDQKFGTNLRVSCHYYGFKYHKKLSIDSKVGHKIKSALIYLFWVKI